MQRKSGGNSEEPERAPKEPDAAAFAALFRDAYRTCFASELSAPLTESESHRLSVEIAESTGLEIGWKSLKNYSNYLLGRTSRVENPSIATLDTLARYVAGAPPTTDEQRRTRGRHYPYWVRYAEALRHVQPEQGAGHQEGRLKAPEDPPHERPAMPSDDRSTPRPRLGRTATLAAAVATLAVVLALVIIVRRQNQARARDFTDGFDDVSSAALAARGWMVQSLDSAHWERRGVTPGHLTLFTLEGDNWPQTGQVPGIRNLVLRPLSADCFAVDVRFSSFVPGENWQQAGLLLLEDTAFAGRSARMSIGYNDFSGGFPQTREVIVQAITSLGRRAEKPEEVVHHRLFVVDSATEALVRENLQSSALRIEKRGAHLRLLASAGSTTNAAFKEVGATDFDFSPRYVAVFAMKGFVGRSADMPVHVDAFSRSEMSCAR